MGDTDPNVGAHDRNRLAEFGRLEDDRLPLAETALLLSAARHPGRALDPYFRHLARLTEEVRHHAGADAAIEGDRGLDIRREALAQVANRRNGYGGGAGVFDDLAAADLGRVIDRRRGLPVALGILYLEICARLDWPLVGIDFPGRFVLRMTSGGARRIIDPFDSLVPLEAPDLRALLAATTGQDRALDPSYLREMSPRRVVLRLEDNIRVRQIQQGDMAQAAETLELMRQIAPRVARLWRETAIISAELERFGEAARSLEEYLRLAPESDDRYQASLMLQELRAKLQ